jgi:four helix bundle protein
MQHADESGLEGVARLAVWQKSRALVRQIYDLTRGFVHLDLPLADQMRRAAVSVPSNISEGNGRASPKDALHFFYVARGSLSELQTQTILAMDLGYISSEHYQNTLSQIDETGRLLGGFIRHRRKNADPKQP